MLTGSLFPPENQEKFIVVIQDLWRTDCGRGELRLRPGEPGMVSTSLHQSLILLKSPSI